MVTSLNRLLNVKQTSFFGAPQYRLRGQITKQTRMAGRPAGRLDLYTAGRSLDFHLGKRTQKTCDVMPENEGIKNQLQMRICA